MEEHLDEDQSSSEYVDLANMDYFMNVANNLVL